ncbi:hypothetical protein RHGRI_025899 [Rhododendron griersonianum]|uniref:Glucose-methanol-choline oxidoreductase N-terminal domain-containing protein n=1 Tax=Rhododendron griersonianum TaxID=479676 RepID=A0AAV6IQV7_9ERIC|nr:hypothetical protein RHGRI_025899 [Rhododendron griersonianum]
MRNATSAPATSYYDYIIVGGGTSGCPLAATLSQNANVLLLERGGSPYGNDNITYLSAFGQALSDLSPTSPSQRFISEDGVISARGRVLGGGSCLNAGFYTRAATSYVAGAGWDGRLANESYDWVERVVAFQPPMLEWQSAVRAGLVEAGVVPDNGFTYDHLPGTKVGAWGMLFFLIVGMPTCSCFRARRRSRPLAHGVTFRDASGVKHKAYLSNGRKNEVIISAGALGSPQLLMLSGLGPADHLKAHNITLVLDLPLVGQGMSDNPMNAVFIPSPVQVEVSLIQVVGITNFGSYIEAASGESFSGPSDFGMFSPKIGQLSTVPPKQRTQEAINKAIETMSTLDPTALRGGFILEKVMGPASTGHLELLTRNPKDNPSVTFNYFQEPEDLQRCVEGIRTIERIIESDAFSKFRYDDMSLQTLLNLTYNHPVNLLPKHVNASLSLEQFCKDTVMTIWHYHGGCQVGRVVGRDYKVLGVDALRVIDGSTFTYSPGTNPQATVMMLGRYMGVQIRSERLASEETK